MTKKELTNQLATSVGLAGNDNQIRLAVSIAETYAQQKTRKSLMRVKPRTTSEESSNDYVRGLNQAWFDVGMEIEQELLRIGRFSK